MKRTLLILLAAFATTGCATAKYTLVSGEYGWDKRSKGGSERSQYSSETMYKINSQTGETWRMTFDQSKGYFWEAINHINMDAVEK
ncbi:MAG: hypothetical protein VB954_13525 [Thalassolituus sp.]|jgi:hypothetical protein|uniref:Lipoprotein n=2 Tax=root TaxID=1 RepID=M5DP02_9GAMM|nr:hypothetical protein [Thalassolituus oleivorans]AHK17666.1 hypothetical protein R615_11215 [Thalassolituus oleivorans R6-15]MCA6129460.1 hypothetical protein [Thalassolituus oleivorans 4BN06-13]PCI46656.1 MAG: hypothetical protein COB43_13585 [Oceanospirillales bacterium]CCU71680.1 hypothetical protein TOL_1252 [Thalassolituus oleivorans MIL-1]|tara:strand:+ start:809 stop:1066 length:258 start_codon:yes stop_codon:yes gene_type:complete